jgi:glycine cleavage system aminomethyltransferase T
LSGIVHPIWRHQDASMYLWQEGERYGIGNYRHEPLIVDPEEIRDQPKAELPFDEEMMAFGRREAERLLPALRGHDVTDRVYGMFSFTPDAQSLVGEVLAVRGLWLAEAVWVTHGAGVGRAVAELMLRGDCELDLRELDVNRFAPHVPARSYVRERGRQQYREVYDVIHPRQQIARPRNLRRVPWFDRQRELGAYFFESNGWERVQWYEANAALEPPPLGAERDGWNAREWSPICGKEHRATREGAGLFDMATFMKIDVAGPGALAALERISCSDLDRPVGRIVYALFLNEHGGIESDVTITRLERDRFLILASAASGPRDLAWVLRQTRDLDGVVVRDVSSAWCALGLWGPRAPSILAPLAECGLSEKAFPPYAARRIFIGGIPCLALRLSYVGEDGWELHVPTEYGGALWDTLWDAGRPYGLVAAGGTAMDSLRLERGFRALGTDLRAEFTPHEAGLGFAVSRKRTDYLGHTALSTRPPTHRLSCLLLSDPSVVLVGKEPILDPSGHSVIGYVSSANFGYTIGQSIALGYLPVELAEPGSLVEVEYFGVRTGATVVEEPLYDPRRKAYRSLDEVRVVATTD